MDLLETTIVFVQELKHGEQPSFNFMEVPSLDFLLRKHVIPMSDEWAAEDEIPTDNPFSKTILFNNKMRITAGIDKLIINQDMTSKESLDDLEKIGIKLLEKIQDVKYSAAGVNFVSTKKCENPGEEIKERFLNSIQKLPIEKIIGGSFSYIYEKDQTRATITVAPVKKKTDTDGDNAVAFKANYHFDNPHIKKIQSFIKTISSLKEDYLEQSKSLFGE